MDIDGVCLQIHLLKKLDALPLQAHIDEENPVVLLSIRPDCYVCLNSTTLLSNSLAFYVAVSLGPAEAV